MQRLSPGRARDHPVMEKFLNKALSLSLSLSPILLSLLLSMECVCLSEVLVSLSESW